MSSVTPAVAGELPIPLSKAVESVDIAMVLRVMMLQSELLQHLIHASFSFIGGMIGGLCAEEEVLLLRLIRLHSIVPWRTLRLRWFLGVLCGR